jgi:hypothetical protein
MACCLTRRTRSGQVHVAHYVCSSASICNGLTRASVCAEPKNASVPR